MIVSDDPFERTQVADMLKTCHFKVVFFLSFSNLQVCMVRSLRISFCMVCAYVEIPSPTSEVCRVFPFRVRGLSRLVRTAGAVTPTSEFCCVDTTHSPCISSALSGHLALSVVWHCFQRSEACSSPNCTLCDSEFRTVLICLVVKNVSM